MPSPAKIAQANLTDYEARVTSRVICPFQATSELPANTRQFRGEIWHGEGDQAIDHGAWTTSRAGAFAEAESLLGDLENGLEKAAELEAEES